MIAFLTIAFATLAQAHAFDGIVCRKYDYYQLGGDRKVFEVAVEKSIYNYFKLTISNLYEVRQPDGTFKVRDRANAENPIGSMLCTQASEEDPKVITCRADYEDGFDYLSIDRIDRTSVMSAMASEPGKIIHHTSYDIELLKAAGKESEFRHFDTKNCVLQ